MRKPFTAILLGCVFSISACGSPDPPFMPPVTPTPPASPPTPDLLALHDETWRLTAVLTAVTGEACSGAPPIGTTHTGQMAGARSSTAVRFLYWVSNYPSDDVRYTGSLHGDEFHAESGPHSVGFPRCEGRGTFEGRVSGRFSNDGRHLEATETWSYRFPLSEFQFTISWSADRE